MHAEEKKCLGSVPQKVPIFKAAIVKLQRTVKVKTQYILKLQVSKASFKKEFPCCSLKILRASSARGFTSIYSLNVSKDRIIELYNHSGWKRHLSSSSPTGQLG